MLFQAKKATNSDRAGMFDQLARMERFAPRGGCLFEYDDGDYRGLSCEEALRCRPLMPFPDMPSTPLDEFLMKQFVACSVGIKNLYYDPDRRAIVVPTADATVTMHREQLKHKLTIEVYEPGVTPLPKRRRRPQAK